MQRSAIVATLHLLCPIALYVANAIDKVALIDAADADDIGPRAVLFVLDLLDGCMSVYVPWLLVAPMQRWFFHDFPNARPRLAWWAARWLVTLAFAAGCEYWLGAGRRFPIGAALWLVVGVAYGCVPGDLEDLPGGQVRDTDDSHYYNFGAGAAPSDNPEFAAIDPSASRLGFVSSTHSVSYDTYRWRRLIAFGLCELRRRRAPEWTFSLVALDRRGRSADFLQPRCADSVVAIATEVRVADNDAHRQSLLRVVVRDPDIGEQRLRSATSATFVTEPECIDTDRGGPAFRALAVVARGAASLARGADLLAHGAASLAENPSGRSTSEIIDAAPGHVVTDYRDGVSYAYASAFDAPPSDAMPLFTLADDGGADRCAKSASGDDDDGGDGNVNVIRGRDRGNSPKRKRELRQKWQRQYAFRFLECRDAPARGPVLGVRVCGVWHMTPTLHVAVLRTPGYLHVLDLADATPVNRRDDEYRAGAGSVNRRRRSARHALVALEPVRDALFARRRFARPNGVHSFGLGSSSSSSSSSNSNSNIGGGTRKSGADDGASDFFCICCRESHGDDTILTLVRRYRATPADRDTDDARGRDSVAFEVAYTDVPFHVEYSEAVADVSRSRLLWTVEMQDERSWRLLTVFDFGESRTDRSSCARLLGAVLSPLPSPALVLGFRTADRERRGSLFFRHIRGNGGGGGDTTEDAAVVAAARRSLHNSADRRRRRRQVHASDTGSDADDNDDDDSDQGEKSGTEVGDRGIDAGQRSSPTGADGERKNLRHDAEMFEVRPFALRPRVSAAAMRGMCGLMLADTAGISRRVSTHAFANASADVADIVTSYCSATPVPVRARQISAPAFSSSSPPPSSSTSRFF